MGHGQLFNDDMYGTFLLWLLTSWKGLKKVNKKVVQEHNWGGGGLEKIRQYAAKTSRGIETGLTRVDW
jgi:hypothetical protein